MSLDSNSLSFWENWLSNMVLKLGLEFKFSPHQIIYLIIMIKKMWFICPNAVCASIVTLNLNSLSF